MKMKKQIYNFILTMVILLLFIITLNTCFAGVKTVTPPTGTEPDLPNLKTSGAKVWGIIRTSLQVAALAAFMFAGVKYMFVSSEQKAELKKSLTMVLIGALITFGSTVVVEVIIKIFEDLTNS